MDRLAFTPEQVEAMRPKARLKIEAGELPATTLAVRENWTNDQSAGVIALAAAQPALQAVLDAFHAIPGLFI